MKRKNISYLDGVPIELTHPIQPTTNISHNTQNQRIVLAKLNDLKTNGFKHSDEVESYIAEWLNTIIGFEKFTITQGYAPKYDIECTLKTPGPNGKKTIKIEVKCQGAQNLFIEAARSTDDDAQPSGLSTTEADIHVFINTGWSNIYRDRMVVDQHIQGKIRIIPTDILREIIKGAELTTKYENKVAGYDVAHSPPTNKNPHTLPHFNRDADGWVASVGAERVNGRWEYMFGDVYDKANVERNASRVRQAFKMLGYLY